MLFLVLIILNLIEIKRWTHGFSHLVSSPLGEQLASLPYERRNKRFLKTMSADIELRIIGNGGYWLRIGFLDGQKITGLVFSISRKI